MSDNLPVKPTALEMMRHRGRPFRMAEIDELQMALATVADELAEDRKVLDLGQALGDIREVNRKLKDLERHIEDRLAETMPMNQVRMAKYADLTLPGEASSSEPQTYNLGSPTYELVLVRRGGHKWVEWNDVDILTDALRHWTNEHSVPLPPTMRADLVDHLLTLMRPSWRTTAMRNAGLDPETYAERVPSRRTVQVQTPNEGTEDDE